MIEKKGYDYDDVRVVIDSKWVSFDEEEAQPDLSFKLCHLEADLPIILYYEHEEGHSAMEKACAENGIITAGAMGSSIPLPLSNIEKTVYGEDKGVKLFEAFSPLSLENRKAMGEMKLAGNSLVVGCSVSVEHARAVANQLKLAAAVLIGPTQGQTTRRLESVGITVPRVSMLEELTFGGIDVPVIATASSPADVCKALVAGADAVLIHFGSPEEGDNLDFAVKAVAVSLRETLTELCLACGAKDIRSLASRCKLTPA
jgi:hypothetical protein